MNDEDNALFRKEMMDVTPIKSDDRVSLSRPANSALQSEARREAAQRISGPSNSLSLPDYVPPIGPLDIVGRRKNGVQEGVYRKLRLGKYAPQAALDLHRVKLVDAHEKVAAFLKTAHEKGLRTVLISHGKGVHSPRPGFLKSYVIHWLNESELVLAYHSAPRQQGGTGATLLLVRKNSDARQENKAFYQESARNQR